MTNDNKNTEAVNHPLAWALQNLCERNKLDIDPNLLNQKLPSVHDLVGFLRTSRDLGLDVTLIHVAAEELHQIQTPVVAFMETRDRRLEETKSATTPSYVINEHSAIAAHAAKRNQSPCVIVRANQHRVVYVEAGNDVPVILSPANFYKRFTGEVIFVRPKSKAVPYAAPLSPQRKSANENLAQELAAPQGKSSEATMRSLAHELITMAARLNDFTVQLIDLASLCEKLSNQSNRFSSAESGAPHAAFRTSESRHEEESRRD